jgi:CRP-like cAMP-binding protein
MIELDTNISVNNSAIFQEMLPEERREVIENGRLVQVTAGEFFFHQGEDSIMMYVLAEGRAKLAQLSEGGDQVTINYMGPGDGLGIIVSLCNLPYPLSAEAVEDCQAMAWDRTTMKSLMRRHPQLALNALAMISQRFAHLQRNFMELSTKRVEQRVARALTRLVRQFGRRTEEGLLIDMPLSRQDLAEMTGTNLYNVSRILSKWEQAGLVSSGRKRVTLLKPHQLVMIAEDLPNSP